MIYPSKNTWIFYFPLYTRRNSKIDNLSSYLWPALRPRIWIENWGGGDIL